jgi:hypothetical protein
MVAISAPTVSGMPISAGAPNVVANLGPNNPNVVANLTQGPLNVVPWYTPPSTQATTLPNQNTFTQGNITGGGGTGPVRPTAAQLAPSLASLDQLGDNGTIINNKNAQSQDEYQKAIDGFATSDALDKQHYDDNTAKNETAYTNNNHSALINAANASTGLRGVLASMGALSGSGSDIVDRLVGLAANSDTGAARKDFTTNATTLNDAFDTADAASKKRITDANDTLANNKQNNEANVLTSRQAIYDKLATLFGSNSAEGNDYSTKSAALAAPIAATTRAQVSPYEKASSLYSPAALQSYLGGTQNLNVNTSGNATPSAPINAPNYGSATKDKLTGVA